MFVLAIDPNPVKRPSELERLTDETRKMLARVARKCKRRGIEGYDQTDEWFSDLDEIVRSFGNWITHQDVVTMVEAIQTTRWKQFDDTWDAVVWEGTDIAQCTRLLQAMYKDGGPRAIQRLAGKPGERKLIISVEGSVEYGKAVVARILDAERRAIEGL